MADFNLSRLCFTVFSVPQALPPPTPHPLTNSAKLTFAPSCSSWYCTPLDLFSVFVLTST